MNRRWPFFFALLFLLGIGVLPGWAQQEEEAGPRLDLVRVDRSEFPVLGLHLIATDGQSRPLEDLQALRLRENGVPIADFTLNSEPVGVDVTFILDVQEIAQEEEADLPEGAPPPLQMVSDSLLRFSGRYMEPGRDRASVLVPAATGGRWLVQDRTEPGELVDALSDYEPLSGQPEVLTMLGTALARMAEHPEGDDLFRAIVLFTDGAGLNPFLFPPLVEQAQTLQVPIFVVLVGPEPGQERREALAELYEPVRGAYLRLTDADEADALYARLQANSVQNVLRYRSNLTSSGQYPIVVSLDGARDEVTLDLEVAPPQVDILLSQTSIRRVGTQADTALEDLQPAVFSIPVEISWPDGMPRPLDGATLRVDGEPQTAPIVGSPDAFTFEWDIADLDEGTYALTVQITDTVGMAASAGPVPVTVELARPEPLPTSTPPPDAMERLLETAQNRLEETSATLIALGFAAALAAVVLIWLRRRPQPTPAAAPSDVADEVVAEDDEEGSLPAAEEVDAPITAVLEVEEAGPVESHTVPLRKENVTIGRDTRAAQIAL
ncbi:MAG: hypothetical protein R3248_09015, partial [Candidatus Promineifilaceae bacterium]|nr:hypothetical protein [Candidatus Promineifilaceae bacterium]